ncbi:MAG: ImmA/IrrE family metallo-endopeptidase, partial [Bryobacterales bacterium]|nr:ImmA/IrrE family metallo-endopeptidase [Bryobacterales bacterium]
MTGQNVIVAPRSRAAIEALAVAVRRALGYDDNEKVSMLKVLEFQLPQILPDFEFAVEDDVVLGGADALTSMTDFSIVVSQTCYDQAYNRTSRRPQFTLAHELGHLLLHSGQSASFTRGVVKPYLSPEWQADCFAAAFLAP